MIHLKIKLLFSSFILFNEDKSKAEIFLPSGNPHSIILLQTTPHIYEKDGYQYDNIKQTLSHQGKILYKAEERQTLIIFYDTKIGKEPLLNAVENYGAKLIYEYQELKGIAISIPTGKTENAIEFFQKIKGVLIVNKDEKMNLH